MCTTPLPATLSADVTVAPAVPTITLLVFTISSSLEASSGLGHGVGRDEGVVNDVHNTAGIDVSGGYFGVVDVDVVVSLPSTVLIFSWFLGSLACTEPEATRRSTLA